MEFKSFASMKPMTTDRWWPADMHGSPDSSGASEGWRYAYFHGEHRLVIEHGEHIAIYETGDTRISGIAQSSGTFPTFKDEEGELVQLASLKLVR
jgi:hypothetical protein